MRTVEITLGGEAFTIAELPVRPNAEWRKRLQPTFAALIDLIQRSPGIELSNPQHVADLLRSASGLFLGSLDTMTALTISYSPALTAKSEWVQEHACESEIMDAFVSVLSLAFPFGNWENSRMMTLIQQMQKLSSPSKPTETSWPAASGESGVTK